MSHPNLYFTNTTLKNNILLYMESAIFFFFLHSSILLWSNHKWLLSLNVDDIKQMTLP